MTASAGDLYIRKVRLIGGELASTEDGRRMARAVVGHQAT